MKRLLIIVVLMVVLGIVGFILITKNKKEIVEVSTGKVSRGELVLKVTARGKIESKERLELRAKVAGVIVYILEEGTKVKNGQLIAAFDDKELLAKQKEQESLLINYQTEIENLKRGYKLKEMEKKIDEAKVSLDEAKRQFLSVKRLLESQSTSEDRFKQLNSKYEKAKIAFDIALCQLEEEKKQFKEKIHTLEAQIVSIRSNLDFIQQQINWSKVCAPIDGIIIHKEIKEGTYVGQGQLLLIVASVDEFIIKMDLDEVDIAKINLNMKSQIMPDAFPGKKIQGIITKIAPSPVLQERINTFEVTIALDKTNLPIRSEMLADVVVISSKKTNVLKIPLEATLNLEDKIYVFVINNKRAIKREVILGLRNPNEAEILTALKEGEEVILNPPPDLKDGVKIKVKKEK